MRQIDGTEALARVRRTRTAASEAKRSLRAKRLSRGSGGLKFRRPFRIGAHMRHDAKVIVELGKSQHGDATAHDPVRDEVHAEGRDRTLRFWNDDRTSKMDDMLQAIRIARLAYEPLPLPQGEGL